MASNRLNNNMRKALKERIIEHAFKEKYAELSSLEKELALEIYNTVYNKDVREKMEKLPQGWLDVSDTIDVYVDGQHHHFKLPRELPFLAKDSENRRWERCLKYLTVSSDPLGSRLLEYMRRYEQFFIDKYNKTAQVHKILKSMTTINKLLEVWPEVEDFVKALTPQQATTTALAARLDVLSLELGLPPTKQQDKQ